MVRAPTDAGVLRLGVAVESKALVACHQDGGATAGAARARRRGSGYARARG